MVLSRYEFSTEKGRGTLSRPIPGSFRLQPSTLQGNCRQGRARARRVLTDEKTIGTLWSDAHDPHGEGDMTIRIPRREFIVALGGAAAWILALLTTSQIASASLASFFWRLTY